MRFPHYLCRMVADNQTLIDLEFPTIISWLEEYAIGDTAKNRIRSLQPINQIDDLKNLLHSTYELVRIKQEGEKFPIIEFEELSTEIKLLPIQKASIEINGFIRIYRASVLSNALIYFFNKREHEFPLLSEIVADTEYTEEIIKAIDKVFDKFGKIKDDASSELFQIRSKIKLVHKQINQNFDREVRKLLKLNLLGDTKETFINERRVLTVLSSHKRKVSGSVVGSSNTGNLTYIEPEVNIHLNNELDILLQEERSEIFRILQVLKQDLSKHLELIKSYQTILTEFDFINCKARLALATTSTIPSVNELMETNLIDAYHPILRKNNIALGKATFPQQIEMNKFGRFIVISGPNAGGKSITLKTVGLLQVMFQSGILVPVHENSSMTVYNQIMSDIGDNQSIINELSTYSYRLKRMRHFLDTTTRKSLLLLDEFGTGSDPDLGGALAEALFEELYNRKGYGVITTHYANIKLKADQLKNAVNGCMLFNTDTLEPTFVFSTGQPGSSFTFEVASNNGIPHEIIELAKGKIDEKKVKMDKLLNDLQKEQTRMSKMIHEYREAQSSAEEAIENAEDARIKYEEKLSSMRTTSESNNKQIQLGKKLQGFIDRYNTRSRKKNINDPLIADINKFLAVEKTKIENAKLGAKKIQVKKQQARIAVQAVKDDYNRDKIVVGSRVKLITTRQIGTVEEINDKNVIVMFGFLRMKVEKNKLMWVD